MGGVVIGPLGLGAASEPSDLFNLNISSPFKKASVYLRIGSVTKKKRAYMVSTGCNATER